MTDVEKKVAYISSIFPNGVVYDGSFLSNQQTLEIITVCNAQKRANVSPGSWKPNEIISDLVKLLDLFYADVKALGLSNPHRVLN